MYYTSVLAYIYAMHNQSGEVGYIADIYVFIQYMVRIWRWCSLRGLHIRFPYMVPISLGLTYMVVRQTFKRKRHCSECGDAIGCYGRCIVPGAAIVTLQCCGRYCSTEHVRTWAGHQATPWQCQFTANRGGGLFCQSIVGTPMRFFCVFLLDKHNWTQL